MRIYDITVPLSRNTPTYPGDPKLELEKWHSLDKGDSSNVTFMRFGAHSGTHVDAPAHFIAGGSPVESLELDKLIGQAQVIEAPSDCECVDEALVKREVRPATRRVLFKTKNSAFWTTGSAEFRTDYAYISPEAATLLAGMGVELVGIDYLSVEKFSSNGFQTHLRLLSKGVVIVEGLNLSEVSAGEYELICLPLRIADGSGDGAPARAVLREL
jgi:arylformamidase